MATVQKDVVKKAVKQGQYATQAEAVHVKNAPLIALLKKLNVKVAPKA